MLLLSAKHSVEVHRRYQNDMYITGCVVEEEYWVTIGTWMEKEKENYQMHVQAS